MYRQTVERLRQSHLNQGLVRHSYRHLYRRLKIQIFNSPSFEYARGYCANKPSSYRQADDGRLMDTAKRKRNGLSISVGQACSSKEFTIQRAFCRIAKRVARYQFGNMEFRLKNHDPCRHFLCCFMLTNRRTCGGRHPKV